MCQQTNTLKAWLGIWVPLKNFIVIRVMSIKILKHQTNVFNGNV